jgi:hypothetical protein
VLGRVSTAAVALLLRRRALLVSAVLLLLRRAAVVSVLRRGRTAIALLRRRTAVSLLWRRTAVSLLWGSVLRQSRSSSLSQAGRTLTGIDIHRTAAAAVLGRSRHRCDSLDRESLTCCYETSVMVGWERMLRNRHSFGSAGSLLRLTRFHFRHATIRSRVR